MCDKFQEAKKKKGNDAWADFVNEHVRGVA